MSVSLAPGAEESAEIIDVGDEVIVHVPLGEDEKVDEVRCEHGVLEFLAAGAVVHATPLPFVAEHRLRWSRNGDVLTAVVTRIHERALTIAESDYVAVCET